MKTGILIIARLGSTRLTRKHLIEANGKPFILWLVERMNFMFEKEIQEEKVQLIICTSRAAENLFFLDFFKDKNITVFFGDDSNIPKRQLECAESLNLKNIVSIDGDDVLCSPYAAKKVYEKLNEGSVYVKTEGLPLGMNVAGYSVAFLKTCVEKTNLAVLETGWGRIFDDSQLQTISINEKTSVDLSALRFTLDYQEDALFFEKIISTLGNKILSISDSELINYVVTQKLYEINNSVNETYWDNFQKNVTKENNK